MTYARSWSSGRSSMSTHTSIQTLSTTTNFHHPHKRRSYRAERRAAAQRAAEASSSWIHAQAQASAAQMAFAEAEAEAEAEADVPPLLCAGETKQIRMFFPEISVLVVLIVAVLVVHWRRQKCSNSPSRTPPSISARQAPAPLTHTNFVSPHEGPARDAPDYSSTTTHRPTTSSPATAEGRLKVDKLRSEVEAMRKRNASSVSSRVHVVETGESQ